MTAPPDLSSTLAPLYTLLTAFNHRNRNQHRRAAWWSRFSLVRRAVRRLLAASSGSGRRAAGADGVVRYARWVDEHVVPPSYVAFTQLTADNQYAPLGLVLLGALAQLHTAIFPLFPAAPPRRPLPAPSARRTETPAPTLALAAEPPLDLGESVSRDEFGPAAPRERGAELTPAAGVSASAPAPKRAKSAPARPDAVRATRNKDKNRNKEKDKDKVKKTKKKAAGTDFSDIFDSLT